MTGNIVVLSEVRDARIAAATADTATQTQLRPTIQVKEEPAQTLPAVRPRRRHGRRTQLFREGRKLEDAFELSGFLIGFAVLGATAICIFMPDSMIAVAIRAAFAAL